MFPKKVTLFEVGPRDGLQNEAQAMDLADKLHFIHLLAESGLQKIEAGSFVSPKWVPQMANSADVFAKLKRKPNVCYSALTPNQKGFDAALTAEVDEIAIFAAASESFSQKNINCSIAKSMKRFEPIMQQAKAMEIPVRGYVSCVVECPYEGTISPQATAQVSQQLFKMGCYEISLGDTIGKGTPNSIVAMIQQVNKYVPIENLALHCHDTYGQAIANIYAALELGVSTIDSSTSGLGGCPYAKGASGNVASEDVLYLLHGLGIQTGVDLEKIITAGQFISEKLNRPSQSKVAEAMSSTCSSH